MSLTAITEEGKRVLLHSNGTWEYSQEIVSQVSSGFRKTNWGMTQQEVRALEGITTLHESNDVLAYSGTLAGLQCNIIFIFVQGRLVRGKYRITESHSNQNIYLLDFDALHKALQEKYGKPSEENMHWIDNTYRNDYEDWGLAISMGHAVRYANWNIGDTDIGLYLTGDNYEVNIDIEYASQTLKYLEEQQKKNQTYEDL